MQTPTGAQIARNIEFLAAQMATRAEADLTDQINSAVSSELGIDPEQVPQRLRNSLSRGSTQVGKDQAIREIQILLATSSTTQIPADQAFKHISNAVAEDRRQAHKLRSQLSSIRSILKMFDDSRTNAAAAYLSSWQLEKRMSLLSRSISSVEALQLWTIDVTDFFEEVSRSTNQSSSARTGIPKVSTSAARNYATILRTFVNRNGFEILDLQSDLPTFSNLNSSYDSESPNRPTSKGTELVIELIHKGQSPFNLKKTWNDFNVAKSELASWLGIAQQLVGSNGRIDEVQINKTSNTGQESLNLQEVNTQTIEAIIQNLI